MIEALERLLREHWPQVSAELEPPRRVHFLKLGLEEYPEPGGAFVLLAFVDGRRHPVAVAKVAREIEGDAGVEHEGRTLAHLQQSLPESLASKLPKLVHSGRLNGRASVLLRALPGSVELHNTWGARRAQNRQTCMESALQWIWELVQSLPAPPIAFRDWVEREALGACLEDVTVLGWDQTARHALEKRIEALESQVWPAGHAHGDFFPGNLLFHRRQLTGVIDWALADARAPLFHDALTYELSFAVGAARAGRAPDASETRRVHELGAFAGMRARMQSVGIDTALGADARVATLLALHQSAWRCGRRVMRRAFVHLLHAEIGAT